MDKMEDGVWRTIGGRRVFIKKGKKLSTAIKESGKFGKTTEVKKSSNEEAKNYLKDQYKAFDKGDISSDELEQAKKDSGLSKEEIEEARNYVNDRAPESYPKQTENKSGNTTSQPVPNKSEDEYNLYKKAMENPDTIDPMTENSTDWEALAEKYNDRYNKERDKNYQDYMAEKKDWDGYEKGIKEAKTFDPYSPERLESIKNALNNGTLTQEEENNALKDFRKITGGKRPDEVYNIENGKYTTKKSNDDGRSFGDKFLQRAKALDDMDKGKISEEEYFNKSMEIEGLDPEKEKEKVKKNLDRLGVERPEFLKETSKVKTLSGKNETDNKGREVSQKEYDDFRQAYKDGKISKEDYRNDNYDALKATENDKETYGNSSLFKFNKPMHKNTREWTEYLKQNKNKAKATEDKNENTPNKSDDWVRDAFNKYKKEHPGTKLTFANFKKNNLK